MTLTDVPSILGKDPLQYGALGLLGIGILAVLLTGQYQSHLDSEERLRMQTAFDKRSAELSATIADLRKIVLTTMIQNARHEGNNDSRRFEIVTGYLQGIKTCQDQSTTLPGP